MYFAHNTSTPMVPLPLGMRWGSLCVFHHCTVYKSSCETVPYLRQHLSLVGSPRQVAYPAFSWFLWLSFLLSVLSSHKVIPLLRSYWITESNLNMLPFAKKTTQNRKSHLLSMKMRLPLETSCIVHWCFLFSFLLSQWLENAFCVIPWQRMRTNLNGTLFLCL